MSESASLRDLTYLVIEANSTCNLSCQTCNRPQLESQGLREKKLLTPEEFTKLLRHLGDAPIDTIKFEGLSEPMLHPRFDRLAHLLRDRFPKAHVIIATNLQYYLPHSPFCATLPWVDTVYLSIDGVGLTYERQRLGAKYDKLTRSLGHIRDLVPAEIRRGKLQINFTATVENYRDLPHVYALKEEYGLGAVRINLAQNWNEDEVNTNWFPREMLEFLKVYKSDVKGVPGWQYRDCFWPHSGTVVDVYGNVRQCLINTSQKPVGNIYINSLEEIFERSPHLMNAREALSANRPAESCRNCDYHHLSHKLREILGEGGPNNRPRRRRPHGT
jgi:radical SAM protein with 4Fe4S-binding SPASM domain